MRRAINKRTASPSIKAPVTRHEHERSPSPSEGHPKVRSVRTLIAERRASTCTAPQPSLMFVAVGRRVCHDDVGTELRQQARSNLAHRAIRAIDDDAQASQPIGISESATAGSPGIAHATPVSFAAVTSSLRHLVVPLDNSRRSPSNSKTRFSTCAFVRRPSVSCHRVRTL